MLLFLMDLNLNMMMHSVSENIHVYNIYLIEIELDFNIKEKDRQLSNQFWFDYDMSPLRVWLEHSISPLIHVQYV